MKKLVSGIRDLYLRVLQSFEVAGMMRAAAELQRLGHDKESRMIIQRVREIVESR